MNYEIKITNMTSDDEMYDIECALAAAGIAGEDVDGIGQYGRHGYPRSVFVNADQVREAVAALNAAGFTTDEDQSIAARQGDSIMSNRYPVSQETKAKFKNMGEESTLGFETRRDETAEEARARRQKRSKEARNNVRLIEEMLEAPVVDYDVRFHEAPVVPSDEMSLMQEVAFALAGGDDPAQYAVITVEIGSVSLSSNPIGAGFRSDTAQRTARHLLNELLKQERSKILPS